MFSISNTFNTNFPRKNVRSIRYIQHEVPRINVQYIRYTQHKCHKEICAIYQIHSTQIPPGNKCDVSDTLNTNVPRKCAVYQIHSTQMSPGNVLRIRHTQDKCPQGKLYDASDTFNTKVPRETSQGSVLFIRYMLHASDGYGPSTQSRVIRRLQKTCH